MKTRRCFSLKKYLILTSNESMASEDHEKERRLVVPSFLNVCYGGANRNLYQRKQRKGVRDGQ